jgi:hypothetical protein
MAAATAAHLRRHLVASSWIFSASDSAPTSTSTEHSFYPLITPIGRSLATLRLMSA